MTNPSKTRKQLEAFLDESFATPKKGRLCKACRPEFAEPLKQWYELKREGDPRAQGTLSSFLEGFLRPRGYDGRRLASLRDHVRNHMELDHRTGEPVND